VVHTDGVPRITDVNIVTTIQQLVALGTASAEVVDALNAIRDGYTDEAYERLEAEHPLIAALISSACDLEYALEEEG
jgi:type II secretory pathway component PulF